MIDSQLPLSKREQECALLILQGLTAKEIAKQLYLSPRTIEYYIAKMKKKCHCRNKLQLLKHLLEHQA